MPSKERHKKAGKTSRDLAIVAIIVLIVIAGAGLLQATRERAVPDPSTSQDAAGMTSANHVAGPNDVLFEESSDRLPADANAKLAVIAETARVENKALTLAVQVENVPGALELARRRADVVRHALEANGIAATSIKSQITATSKGAASPQRIDRVFVVLR